MNTDEVWRKLAETDPYWAVVSLPEYRAGVIDPAARERFFADGKAIVLHMLERARRISPNHEIGSAIDFGCGVGRLSRTLVERGIKTYGVDVAPEMLRMAEENCASPLFHAVLGDDALSQVPEPVDATVSSIVFQHLDPQRGLRLYRRLFELTRPGGFSAHFFIFSTQGRRGATNIGSGVEREIQMNEYDMNAVMEVAAEFGDEVQAELFPHGEHTGINLYVRRAAAA